MWKGVLKVVFTFAAGILCFIIGKFIFLLFNLDLYQGITFSNLASVFYHGFAMDMSVAGYLTVIPALLFLSQNWVSDKRIIKTILKGYLGFISFILSLIILIDSVLYGFWGFKLDSTPIFYFLSSPSSALASAETWMYVIAVPAVLICSALFFYIYYFSVNKLPEIISIENNSKPSNSERIKACSLTLVATILLIIPIRGGVTVSTMNISRAYFSNDQKLNHASINPAFSLLSSLTHQNDFKNQYRFMREDEANTYFSTLKEQRCDSTELLIDRNSKPDIYLIILESFSTHLFPSLGGEKIATGLDSIAQSGLLFENIYANSFRTDRGLVSILSGYPAQPNTSIMKFVDKAATLPSISKSLKEQKGYETEYYYGGDANFTNMKAYLLNSEYDMIISDQDFPLNEKLSKWGAHDDALFKKIKNELNDSETNKPVFRVIQTSSSHEPFDVPYSGRPDIIDKRARAFAFADSCVTDFVNFLNVNRDERNNLIIIIPDHYGAYPDLKDETLQKHRIPLILTGNALQKKGRIKAIGSQTDLAATVLSILGADYSDFIFSHNLLNNCNNHFGFFTEPSLMGFITEKDTLIYNLDTSEPISKTDINTLKQAQSYLQNLYDDLSKR